MQNILRVATVTPKVHIGDPYENSMEICNLVGKVRDADVIVTPELSLTGYTCQDMFMNDNLLCRANSDYVSRYIHDSVGKLIDDKKKHVIALGAPLIVNNVLYNCAIIVSAGKSEGFDVLGIVPKSYIPNYNEYYEKRWFTSGMNRDLPEYIDFLGKKVRFGTQLLFKFEDVTLGVEICEDLWSPNPPSTKMALAGADVILNLSASNETIGKMEYRRELVKQQSARCVCGYVYCSAGSSESTSDVVFGGHNIIAENGHILSESKPFSSVSKAMIADIDLDRIRHDRLVNKTFADSFMGKCDEVCTEYGLTTDREELRRDISITPFVPSHNIDERCYQIVDIQSEGLASRLRNTKSKHLVIGVSGGLDSTLALLVACNAADKAGMPRENIIGITMPCFGTSSNTLENSKKLVDSLGCTLKIISIEDSVKSHLKDIGLSTKDRSVAYENAQARERTQVLMDYANMVGGFVVGTGDLSELALGWCTYNGDHMSMYNVNCSIPKTLVRKLVHIVGEAMLENDDRQVIWDILDTPVSPELLPPDKDGKIAQLTEDSVGPYVLNDFFLYYTLRYGFTRKKIAYYAIEACKQSDKYTFSDGEIYKWLDMFYVRFAKAQFKRNCCPDGVKVGTVSLNPRGDWRMPSEYDMTNISIF